MKIPVLYYHSVAPFKNPSWDYSFLTYELHYFEDLLKYLRSAKYDFIFLDELYKLKSRNLSSNKKLICLTFDDGYLDNWVYIFPLLKKYDACATIFIAPEFMQDNKAVRPNLEDVKNGDVEKDALQTLGFLSWQEIKLMQASGYVDFQSHTMTHTKLYAGDKLRGFHHPGADYLYPVANKHPRLKPYYITSPEFKNMLPYGTPFFEEKSAIICRKITINPDFESECSDLLKGYNWSAYNFDECLQKVKPCYDHYVSSGSLILEQETEASFEKRQNEEIALSKATIEAYLNKPVNHICWPHGDYDAHCHHVALRAGYKSSHIVYRTGEENYLPDRFDRISSGAVAGNRSLTLLKAKLKIKAYRGEKMFVFLKKLMSEF